jgi:peptide/nickel transport system permease protein
VSWRALLRRPNAVAGGVLLAVMLSAAIVGHVYTPYDPVANDLLARLKAPSMAHWLGTDEWGRDVLSRLLFGAGVSVSISFFTVVAAVTIGALVGVATGYFGGWFERAAMAILDALLAFPFAHHGARHDDGVRAFARRRDRGAFARVHAVRGARGPRHRALGAREGICRGLPRDGQFRALHDVSPRAAELRRADHRPRPPRSSVGRSLPRARSPFSGLGVPPPASSWGGMLSDSRNYVGQAPWLALVPGISISVTLLGINLFGDALRDQFDPRMKNL